jgi:hypothetical protein
MKGDKVMASLLDTLAQSVTPEAAAGLGKALGLNQDQLTQGLGVVGPLMEGVLGKSASSSQGLDSLMETLGKVQGAQAAGTFDVGKLVGQFAQGAGGKDMVTSMISAALGGGTKAGDPISGLLGGLFGNGLGAVGGTLDKTLGFPVSSLIPVAAPALMGVLAKVTKEKNLDANGVSKMLQDESKEFMDKGGDTAALVQKALKAGDDANALRARYSGKEWSTLRLAPMAAAGLVMVASPSKGSAAAQELAAALAAIEGTKAVSDPSSLLSVAFDSPLSEAEKGAFTAGVTTEKMGGAIKNAATLLGSKDPAALNGYRTLVMNVANAVAEASKEGGFLGIGAKQVSDAERTALAEIKAAIGA